MSRDTYRALVETLTDQRAKELGTGDKGFAFLSVANDLVLQPYDLSLDEVEAGVTDGSGDGQIDAMYVLVNGTALSDEAAEPLPEKGALEIEIIIVQAKNSVGFEENVLKIMRTTIADLLDLKKDYSEAPGNYSAAIQAKFAVARQALLASVGRTASISVRLVYATKGGVDGIHPSVHAAAEALKASVRGMATGEVTVDFVGAEELIATSRLPKTRSRKLEIQDSISSDTGDSFVCLVTLGSLVAFLSDDKGVLIRSLFDANVRDFLGKTEVNDAIRGTLEELEDGDFWWFNNGITIVAADIDQKGKVLALEDPLLVNGLQSSNVVFSFMTDPNVAKEVKEKQAERIVLVKIIQPPSEKLRDDVIKATNSQTHIPKPYLRGMDRVHRNIEDHLKGVGLFYERRKNQYKNLGKKRSEIVTLSEAAQILMAAFLFRAADARGRPNSLLKSDDDYTSLFSENYHLDAFKNVIQAKRLIAERLAKLHDTKPATFRNDVIFHVLGYASARDFGSLQQAAAGWRNKVLTEAETDEAIKAVVALFDAEGATDRVAKSTDFQNKVVTAARAPDIFVPSSDGEGELRSEKEQNAARDASPANTALGAG